MPHQPRRKQSWGELLAGWLLIAWGAAAFAWFFLVISPSLGSGRSPVYRILDIAWLAQVLLNSGAGLAFLLRWKMISRGMLLCAALSMLVFSTLLVCIILRSGFLDGADLAFALGIGGFALGLLFLVRWLDRPRDSRRGSQEAGAEHET